MHWHCTLLYICGTLVHILHGEVFSSVYKLSILAKEEGKLLRAFKKYFESQKNKGKTIDFELQRLMNDLDPAVRQSCENERYAENPLNSYHMIGRFVYKWPVVYSNILCENCEKDETALYLNTTYEIVTSTIGLWPNEYDIKAAAEALLRLRIFYYFDIDEAINGHLFGETASPMIPSQILKIIKIAADHQMLHESKLWCEALLRRLPYISYQDEGINVVSILRMLGAIYTQAGMLSRAAETLKYMTNIGYADIDADYNYYKNLSNATVERQELPLTNDEYDDGYKQLCRDDIKNIKELSKLYCYLRNTSIPFYKGKVEVVNIDPPVVLFHDVISETEAEVLKAGGSKKFTRSTIVEKENYRTVADHVRISQTAWLYDEPGIIERATRRVGILTGLNTKSALVLSNSEAFQIVNYGIGGMYHPHLDALDRPLWLPVDLNDAPELRGTGDRVATWMFYLNDVKVGGATVFPQLNARVPVVKGGAAFWYNLKPSGENDVRTLHAGCPVVIGSKWIGNKWIRETGQMFRRPCDLQP